MTEQPNEGSQNRPAKEKRPRKPKGRAHGEGSVFERKTGDRNKSWVAQIPLGGGKKQTVGYYATKQEALAAKNKALQEIDQIQRVKNSRQTLGEYLEYWLEHVHRLDVRVSTYVQNCILLRRHLIPALGHIPIQKLTARDIQQLYSKLHERLSAGRIRNLHALLHKALKHAVQQNLVKENVSERVTRPHEGTVERPVLTPVQAQLLVRAAKGTLLETLLIVAVTTGIRHGELRALRWQDIDFDRKEVHIRYSSGRVIGYGNVLSEPKTRKSRRTVALHAFVMDALKSHRVAQLEQRLKAGSTWHDLDLVFPGRTGNYFDRATFYKHFYQVLAKAGLPRIRPHDLRHSAATMLLATGVNIRVVQEILGHSNVSITLGTYGHVLPGMQEEAMRKWDNVFGQQEP